LRKGVCASHDKCALIPLVSYNTPLDEVRRLADEGHFFFKIKIGHPGSQEKMLAKDCNRAGEIHDVLRSVRTRQTATGRACYYFDANGRYGGKETLVRFVEHLDRIGALEQTAIVEEPFEETDMSRVDDIPLRIAADESAHTVEDAVGRMELGYGAMALKPIAKTMSLSLRVAAAAAERGVPCFCADLTVNPTLVEWNRAVARRLPQFPGIGDLGLLETNGAQNYLNWDRMARLAPKEDALW
jgi:L-alanine-DL-glutamate epimerase-like enolase superfamily enzyme